ncbi:pseudouridine synthase [Pontibacter liquoris]|uniref:pseudouridine synthase n=1 Tax=Pontibacter liquoris TaxID=2905677 RepID=UPI001FA7EF7E|nr:pseudouridine synthase [Pontibacter liquoris]
MAKDNERPARGNAGEGRRGAGSNATGRPNSDRDGKKIFNRRDKPERRSFGSDRPGRDQGDRKPFGGGNREGGERRSYGNRKEGGEYPSFTTGRREGGDDRRTYNDRREKPEGGERRSYSENRDGGERKSFGANKREGGERRSYGNDRREGGGERRSYDRADRGERKPYNADRRDDRRDARSEGKPAYGEKRGFGADKGSFKTDRPGKYSKPDANSRGSRDRANDRESTPEAPDYNLSRYNNNPRIKKTNIKEEDDGTIRLNRFIANAGICSRREADLLIEAGEIKVNGEVVKEMGFKVKPTDSIQYGKKILNREKLVYVLLNKPKDFLTTTDDPEGRKTVMSLVANASTERIFPVGRLDRNTTGLLLFTNDGELAQKLTHPSNGVKKIYQVELDKPITKADFVKVAEGVELEDGKAEVDDVALLGDASTFLGLEIHIGRNRIVRRIFEHLGYDVVSLDRVQYAGLTKKDLPRGNWRYLTEKEVIRLKYFM